MNPGLTRIGYWRYNEKRDQLRIPTPEQVDFRLHQETADSYEDCKLVQVRPPFPGFIQNDVVGAGGWDLNPHHSGDISRATPLFLFSWCPVMPFLFIEIF